MSAAPKLLPPCDDAQVRRFASYLLKPGLGCLEVRLFNAAVRGGSIVPEDFYKSTLHGYFDSPDAVASEFVSLRGVSAYVTFNPVSRDLLGRSRNRIIRAREGQATSDEDIERLSHLFVDVDPRRKSGISSNDAERGASLARREKILAENPELAASSHWGCSGNGDWILVRLPDYPNDPIHNGMVARFLKDLGSRYSDGVVEIDRVTKNASRVMCHPGTRKCKGDDLPERPHRMATIDSPDRDPAAFDLVAWAAAHPEPERPSPPAGRKAASGRAGPGQPPRSRYAQAAFDAEVGRVRSAGEGHRNDQLNLSAFALGQFVGAGELARADVEQVLADAGRAIGLGDREVESTIRSGLTKGMTQPRDLSGVGPGVDSRRTPGPKATPARDDRGDGRASPVGSGGGRLIATPGVKEAFDDPHRLARTFVLENYSHPDHPRIVCQGGDFFVHEGGCYQAVPDATISGDLTHGIKVQFDELNLWQQGLYRDEKKRHDDAREADPRAKLEAPVEPVAKKVTGKIHSDVMRAARSMTGISHLLTMPCWLTPIEDAPDPLDILPTRDGLVDLSTIRIEGEEDDQAVDLAEIRVFEPTPAYFSSYALPYSFDPWAPPPRRWLEFLGQIFPEDPASIRELQKWFGYLITSDTRQQKMLYLIGKPRSGKGTVARVLEGLIGQSNIVSPALMDLAEPFGLSDCVGKTLMSISDARVGGLDKDLARLQERLLKISGQDLVQVNRKNRPMLSIRLRLRVLIISNEVPGFRDSSGAFKARMRPLRFLQSFEGREDGDLYEGKLVPELPGILNWAIAGRAMLVQDGGFFVPDSAQGLVQTLAESATPIGVFLAECCILTDPHATVRKEELYQAYRQWCERTGNQPKAMQTFGKLLKGAHPEIDDARLRDDEARYQGYRGIKLAPDVVPEPLWNGRY